MKVIGYIRVSTEEQGRSGLGLEAQEKKIRAYVDLYDLELVDLVVDPGFSGKNLKRPGIQQVLARLSAGEAEGLVVAKLDRLTRSVRDMADLAQKAFMDRQLFSVGENVDTRSAAGRLVLNVLVSVGQWEREVICERTTAALGALRERGHKTGGDVPFGFNAAPDGHLQPNEKEQKIIRLIASLKAKGHSLNSVARELNRRGLTTKAGAAWKPMQVKRALERRAA